MGSGCTSSKYNKACLDPISSDCVLYEGSPVDSLGICTGDTITEVLAVILAKLELIAQGKGIKLNDLIVGCADLSILYQNSDKELASILQIILDKECSLQSQIDALTVTVNNPSTAVVVDLKCLTVTGAVTRSKLDQAIIDKICSLESQIQQLQTQIPTNTSITTVVTDILFTKLQSCNGAITVTGTGANRVFNISGLPKRGIIFTDVDPSKFDATGLGMDEWCGYAYCNGKNGTRDMGGLALAQGVVKGSPYTGHILGEIKGTENTILQPENIPNHTHSVVDPGHKHSIKTGAAPGIAYGQYVSNTSNPSSNFSNSFTNTTDILTNTTGISVGGVNGATAQPFTNLQPTLFGAWIQRIV